MEHHCDVAKGHTKVEEVGQEAKSEYLPLEVTPKCIEHHIEEKWALKFILKHSKLTE